MSLSIIIVTWNSANEIIPCLDSIFEQIGPDDEVFVIDNASQDDTVKLAGERFGKIALISNSNNLGYARATNQGLDKATGDYILLLNPDTILMPNAIEAMMAFMESNPHVGAIGPQLLNTDGTIQPSCREFPRPEHLIYEFTGLSKIFPQHKVFGSWRMGYFDHNSLREVDQPMGACLMVRRSVIAQVGPIDEERFPMFLNEVDWCWRIKSNGWKIVFFPRSQVIHIHGVSVKKARLAMTVSSHRSLAVFFDKYHGKRFSTLMAKSLLLIALPPRLLFQYLSKKLKLP
jgi:GT2 family glycosyltransferase